jgi:hypothetical protein
MVNHTGHCLCGEIQFEISRDPLMAGVCHCKNCQRQAGSAFSTLWGVPKEAFTFVTGEPKLFADTATDSGNTVERYFCGNCGSPIYSVVPGQPDVMFLKTGTLDDTAGFTPQFHVWCDSKQNWVELGDSVPTMAKQS